MTKKRASSLTATSGKPGSSLILVVVVISAIITVVFGANRLALVQYNQSNRDEDNISALYAAKAGIEDGLMRFRYNRDVETTLNKVARFDLTSGKTPDGAGASGEVDANIKVDNPGHQSYDLGINFRVQSLGDFGFINPFIADPQPLLRKDNFIELTGFEKKNDPYYLRVAFKFYNPGATSNNDPLCANDKAFVQIQRVVNGTTTEPFYQNSAKIDMATHGYQSKDTANIEVNPISAPDNLASIFRFRPYYCDVAYAITTSNSTNGSGENTDAGPLFGGLHTTIKSTGYFGAAKRTLIADVDRVSGQLISIYDFNIYAGTGDIKP